MSEEQVWIKNTDDNSTMLYKLVSNDNSEDFEYYSKNDNHEIENLVNLTYINLPTIMNVLKSRYGFDNIYTLNGDILISINPFKKIDIYDCKKNYDITRPHIYVIAEKAYRNVHIQNQSILVSGESGSGKTENTKYILKYLCNNYADNDDIASKIINSNYLIELFGNAKTIRNTNSSRFGKFIKLYLNDDKIIGANIENYLLEKSRISFSNSNERTYHIFYLLCSAKNKLDLFHDKDATNYKLLVNSKYRERITEFENFDLLIETLEQFKFTDKEQQSIFGTIKLILELLNCSSKEELSVCLSKEYKIVEMLNLDVLELFKCLTTKTYIISNERIVKQLELEDIIVSIKTFCEDRYESIFNEIIDKVSNSLGNKTDKYIGILDIFGFEVFENNGYEQLCINYTNEMLQQIFNQYVFKSEQSEYEKENLEWKHIDYVQNDDIIDVFNGKISLFSIINEQTILGSGNDDNIYGQFEKYIPEELFKIDELKRKDHIFSIKHFTGKVDYQVDNYVLKNRITRSNTKIKTNLQYFNNQLSSLKNELLVNNCQFVRCIKPNNKNVKEQFDEFKIYDQLLYSGIIEGIKIVLAGYPIKKNKTEINHEFRFYSYYNKKRSITDILDKEETDANKFQIGNSKIFMKSNFYKELSKINHEYQCRIVTQLQKNIRKYIAVRKYFFTLYYTILIQNKMRQYLCRVRVIEMRKHKNAILINSYIRRFIYKKKYIQYKSATIISKNIRTYIQRKRYQLRLSKLRDLAAVKITFWFKRILINKKIFNRSVINKLTLKLEDSHKDLLSLKTDLLQTQNELKTKNILLNSKEIEIKKLKDEVKSLKKSIVTITSVDTLNDIDNEMKIKKNMDNLLNVNQFDDSIDIIDNYDPGEEIVNNTKDNDDDTTKDIPIKTITMNELYNIPLSSDSDNDLSLNKDDIEYIQNKKLEELGAKMEKLYMELQNKKQIIEYMRSKYVTLERSYQIEKLKKTNIWEIMHSYFSSSSSR